MSIHAILSILCFVFAIIGLAGTLFFSTTRTRSIIFIICSIIAICIAIISWMIPVETIPVTINISETYSCMDKYACKYGMNYHIVDERGRTFGTDNEKLYNDARNSTEMFFTVNKEQYYDNSHIITIVGENYGYHKV